ncbi:hypothetical protein PMAYCL1PPCAC_31592, partial [Pristionchus mayeri]
ETYSVLLFNSAVTDFVVSVIDASTMIRMVVDQVSIVYIYSGPCSALSENACFFLYSLMLHLTMHSIALIAVSFWFRSTAVSGDTPTLLKILIICLLVISPSLALAV